MYYFIVNPASKSGKGLAIWKRLEPVLEEREVEYKAFLTKGTAEAEKIAASLTKGISEDVNLVVLGGDGTINEVLNGIVSVKHTILSYIPTGSSNDFARSLRMKTEPMEALLYILEGGIVVPMDYGILTDSTGVERRFMVSAGIGFDAAVCQEAMHSHLKNALNHLKLGKLTYLMIAIKQLLHSKLTIGTLEVDGKVKMLLRRFFFASFQNHAYEGGGFLFCPKADPTDDILDLCLVDGLSKMKVLMTLPLARKGYHTKTKGVVVTCGTHYHIKLDRLMPVHTDGEFIGLNDELRVQLAAGKLRVRM